MAWDLRYKDELLRRLRRRLVELGYRQGDLFFQKIDEEIEHTIAEHSHMVIDEKTIPHLRMTASVLACYRALASGPLKRDRALEMVEDAFVSIGRTTLNFYTRAILTFSRDPFTAITKAGRKALDRYGGAWEFRFEETPFSFTMTCTRCFYYDFFSAVKAQHLTRVFCSWDRNWIQPLDAARHGVLFERPTTMGYGGNACPFIFKRAKPSIR